eukprot:TRINITY_DN583_c2_g1_i1.p1 TRINITY_DN583_c2_g1~~TRINITY_DN583_c2_g1_i1.p1  ORF type:complete len:1233 (-),score=306.15 TRINITY_DN583_c2_g1_i1:28-3393(-)
MCPIERDPNNGIRFSYQNRTFIWDYQKQIFQKLDFPVHKTFGEYQNASAISDAAELKKLTDKYGENKFDIPLPTFKELYLEHAVAPFFVFQVVCCFLWFLDEYWYYSIFILIMLVVLEGTVVNSRLQNLQNLRKMIAPPVEIHVLRSKKWELVPSTQLVPGDIVCVKREKKDYLLPCDLLLLSGTAITNEAMLTGESTPQLKEPIVSKENSDVLSIKSEARHMLFGGTTVVQTSPDKFGKQFKAPGGGCVAYVLRTGFNTSQGRLMRTILYSSTRVTANNTETLVFILFLMCFALVASGYVLMKGLEDDNRNRYKLLVKCSLIITSVVPPELPTELSMAVNTSLQKLQEFSIYCTEPFRIPFAGKIDTCCFDKTGTLTDEHLVLKGITGIVPDNTMELVNPEDAGEFNIHATYAMAACNSLSFVDKEVVGDPMESETLKGIHWKMTANDTFASKQKLVGGVPVSPPKVLNIRNRFHFSSTLARMSVVVAVEHEKASNGVCPHLVLTKGAPETIKNHLESVPSWYEDTYLYYAQQGKRVIATAYKPLTATTREISSMSREVAESNLIFSGFIIFECPVKEESAEAMAILASSSHNIIMITGDNPLTACQVGRELKIATKPIAILELNADADVSDTKTISAKDRAKITWDPKNFHWKVLSVSVGQIPVVVEPFDVKTVKQLAEKFDFCVYGDSLGMVLGLKDPNIVFKHTKIVARASPEQKAKILSCLKAGGQTTLMCGDGTNDVGALKQAHVGIALVNDIKEEKKKSKKETPGTPGTETPAKEEEKEEESGEEEEEEEEEKEKEKEKEKETPTSAAARRFKAAPGAARAAPKGAKARMAPRKKKEEKMTFKKYKKLVNRSNNMRREMLRQYELSKSKVQFGDASIASPFTSKSSSVLPITDVIRQGRCTLVTTFQMFRILALNCLVTAYSLSVLYMEGIKLGDFQATAMGFLTAFCFLFISRSEPLPELSAKKPLPNLFSPYMLLAVIGQFAIHLSCIVYVVGQAQSYYDGPNPDPDADFVPNIMNSAIFLIMNSIQVTTFAVNHHGHPFMDSITENLPLFGSLAACAVVTFIAALELIPMFNSFIQLVPLHPEFRPVLLTVMIFDSIAAYFWERTIRKLFA